MVQKPSELLKVKSSISHKSYQQPLKNFNFNEKKLKYRPKEKSTRVQSQNEIPVTLNKKQKSKKLFNKSTTLTSKGDKEVSMRKRSTKEKYDIFTKGLRPKTPNYNNLNKFNLYCPPYNNDYNNWRNDQVGYNDNGFEVSTESEKFFGMVQKAVEDGVKKSLEGYITIQFQSLNNQIEHVSRKLKNLSTSYSLLCTELDTKITNYGEEQNRRLHQICMKLEYDKLFYQNLNAVTTNRSRRSNGTNSNRILSNRSDDNKLLTNCNNIIGQRANIITSDPLSKMRNNFLFKNSNDCKIMHQNKKPLNSFPCPSEEQLPENLSNAKHIQNSDDMGLKQILNAIEQYQSSVNIIKKARKPLKDAVRSTKGIKNFQKYRLKSENASDYENIEYCDDSSTTQNDSKIENEIFKSKTN